jgi:hypothetical protein
MINSETLKKLVHIAFGLHFPTYKIFFFIISEFMIFVPDPEF